MKIATRQIEQFVKNPEKKFLAILVFGPDEGLVRERAKIMGKTIVEDLNDPFNSIDITSDSLKESPEHLIDELNSISMMGGRRLIRIRDASDKIIDSLTDVLKNAPQTDNIVILEAGDLKPTSKIRKICEKQANAAAIPCYVEDARQLGQVIVQKFTEKNITITTDALQDLTAKLVGDRALAVQMAEKIITYIGKDKKEIDLDDIIACTEDTSILFMSDLIKNALSGNIERSSELLNRLFQEGIPAVAICRGFQNYLNRLAVAKAHLANGEPIKFAMMKTRPPVFFKEQTEFIKHTNIWSVSIINTLLEQLMDTEATCKRTNAPEKIICDRIVFKMAHMGKKLQKRSKL